MFLKPRLHPEADYILKRDSTLILYIGPSYTRKYNNKDNNEKKKEKRTCHF